MARSTSSTPDYYPEASTSAYKPAYDDIPPIPFEKESELNQVLTRLRAEIISTAKEEWLKQDGDLSELERVGGAKELLETFFDELSPVIRSNCTFKGKIWEVGDSKAPLTEPFNDIKHEKIIKLQSKLYSARLSNVGKRLTYPERASTDVKQNHSAVQTIYSEIEQLNAKPFPPPPITTEKEIPQAGPSNKRRKSIKSNVEEAPSQEPSREQAEEEFMNGLELLDQMNGVIENITLQVRKANQVQSDAAFIN